MNIFYFNVLFFIFVYHLKCTGLAFINSNCKTMKIIYSFILLLLTLFFNTTGIHAQPSIQEEKDCLLALASLTYVYQDWQTDNMKNPRGYNIGAVLFDVQADTIVALDRNSIAVANDKTQHAELRLMQAYMKKQANPYLTGMKIITTLEPCMMCSGMMTFLQADTTCYIQEDPEYGKNIERLAVDWKDPATHKIHPANDRCKNLKSLHASTFSGRLLEMYYKEHRKRYPDKGMSEFLYSPEAKLVFQGSEWILKSWSVMHPENEGLYVNILCNLNLKRGNENSPYGEEAHEKNKKLSQKHYPSLPLVIL